MLAKPDYFKTTLIDGDGNLQPIEIRFYGNGIGLYIYGMGTSDSVEGEAVYLDWNEGKLQLVLNLDVNSDEQTLISLEGARTSQYQGEEQGDA